LVSGFIGWYKPRSDQTSFSARRPWASPYLTLGLF
jgi:hypothetical protein